MAASFNFYPILDKDILSSLNPKVDFSFSYRTSTGAYSVLEFKIDDKNITFKNCEEWNPYLHSLMITTNIQCDNYKVLFGPEGIAPTGSKLGIALEVFSNNGKFRKVYFDDDNEIVFNNEQIDLNQLFISIGKNTINRELTINLLIYLKEKSNNVIGTESFLNNDEGTILGKLASYNVFLSGFGSLFPIYSKPIDDKKLWILEIDYDDPADDKLSDCVKIILNTNSKDYKYINQKDEINFCSKVIYEIVASALTILIIDLKENHYLENLDGNYADGSILQFIKYYKETLGLDIRDPNNISSTLRDYFEK